MTDHVAYLTGTRRNPRIELKFNFGAKTAHGTDLMRWVKTLPDRGWDPANKQWVITGVGNRPDEVFAAAGVTVDFSRCEGDLSGVTTLAEVWSPMWQRSTAFPGEVLIRPRLVGANALWERLGGGLVWEKKTERFSIMLMDLIDHHGKPKKRFELDPEAHAAAIAQRTRATIPEKVRDAARKLAVHSGVDPDQAEQKHLSAEAQDLIDTVATHTGHIPEWFGLDLFPFQRCGVYAAAAGHNYLADEPGLGKGSPRSTRILTPTGWTTYGQIRLGDKVIGANGQVTTVTGVFPRGELDVFTVTMNDGSSVVVDGEHLWQIEDILGRLSVAHTRAIRDELEREKLTGERRFTFEIPLVEPVQFAEQPALPVTPAALAKAIVAARDHRTIRILDQFLFATVPERYELLIGIVDIDPGVGLTFVTTSVNLAEQVTALTESLGGQTRAVIEGGLSDGVTRLEVLLPTSVSPEHAGYTERNIVSVTPAGRDDVVCISVEAEDQLYVTEHCIVTHNTRQGLGVMALRGFNRAVIVCPPLVLTNWARETAAALSPGMPADPPPVPLKSGKMPKKPDFPDWLKVIYPTRKMPAFPDRGVIIVADSLLSSRPELLQELIAWGPTVMLADEVHRLKTWTTDRGVAVRRLATAVQTVGGLSVPLTGTPLLASSPELANQLQISGHLGPIFGGASQYMEKFALRNHFGGWGSRKRAMPELHALLYGHSWVRRNKTEVLKQLPKKWRVTRYVDVPTTLFTKAHEKLYEKIGEWVEEMTTAGRPLNDETIKKYAGDNIGLISPMRVAAGVAKVPAAIDYVNDWMASTTRVENGKKIYDRPLVVWTHHRDVMNALIEAVPAGKYDFGTITGDTPATGRAAMADRYQAGEIGILFASIQAAGFGITLTKGSDSLFVETDWTNASISQAEDRQWRIGQVNPVVATTLISKETLDVSIRAVQRRKAELLNVVVPGGDSNVADADARLNAGGGVYEEIPEDELEEGLPKNEFEIVERIVKEVVAMHAHRKTAAKRAA
jgi:hypothetical protein